MAKCWRGHYLLQLQLQSQLQSPKQIIGGHVPLSPPVSAPMHVIEKLCQLSISIALGVWMCMLYILRTVCKRHLLTTVRFQPIFKFIFMCIASIPVSVFLCAG